MFSKKTIKKNIIAYSLATLLCIIILIWVMRLWDTDLKIPGYSGDELLYGTMIKGIVENGWYFDNKYLAAPIGSSTFHYNFSFGADNLHYILIKFISLFTSDWAVSKNIFTLSCFFLITLSSLFVLRQLGLSYASAIVGSLLYAWLPYNFFRGQCHPFLAAYYMMPLAILLALWVYSGNLHLFRYNKDKIKLDLFSHGSVSSVVVCLLISSSGMYYAFFTCFFIIVAGITSFSTARNYHKLINAGILVILISIGVLINISPSLYYWHKHKDCKLALVRRQDEAEIYGLKISQLIFPINGHRVPCLAKFKDQYNYSAPLVNENHMASLGIIGSLGFLFLLLKITAVNSKLFFSKQNSQLLGRLAILNISGVLLATVGGFSAVLSYTILPIMRSYNRISIFIAFFSLTAFFLFIENFFKKYLKRKVFFYFFLSLILIIGVLDQTAEYFGDEVRSYTKRYVDDGEFIQKIEAILPADAMVFQLPYVPFPENSGFYKMCDYEHFIAYLHSKTLRWSYGVLKGSQEDKWQREISEKPVDNFLEDISARGFSGVYLNRNGYPDGGSTYIESELSFLLDTKPLVSSDGRIVFFDLSGYNKKHKK